MTVCVICFSRLTDAQEESGLLVCSTHCQMALETVEGDSKFEYGERVYEEGELPLLTDDTEDVED